MSKDKDTYESDEDGHALWQMIARTVKPIKNNLFHPAATVATENVKKSTSVHTKQEKTTNHEEKETPKRQGYKALPLRDIDSDGGQELDRRLNERLRRGQVPIDMRIDLHGHTQAQAQHILQTTLLAAYRANKRCVLVVTGKGKHTRHDEDGYKFESGVLKQMVPEWLSSPPLLEIVLKTHAARPKDGGTGALYVLLRRQR